MTPKAIQSKRKLPAELLYETLRSLPTEWVMQPRVVAPTFDRFLRSLRIEYQTNDIHRCLFVLNELGYAQDLVNDVQQKGQVRIDALHASSDGLPPEHRSRGHLHANEQLLPAPMHWIEKANKRITVEYKRAAHAVFHLDEARYKVAISLEAIQPDWDSLRSTLILSVRLTELKGQAVNEVLRIRDYKDVKVLTMELDNNGHNIYRPLKTNVDQHRHQLAVEFTHGQGQKRMAVLLEDDVQRAKRVELFGNVVTKEMSVCWAKILFDVVFERSDGTQLPVPLSVVCWPLLPNETRRPK